MSHVGHQVGRVDMFHSNMARLLSQSKCAHPDMQTSTSFLWWVDASFAAHPDMTSHTGGMMTLGQRQKINTKSTTETKLVRVDDVMPQNPLDPSLACRTRLLY